MKYINNTYTEIYTLNNYKLFMCVLFYSSSVCISAYANEYFKTTIIKQNIKIILLALLEYRSIRSGASGNPYYCAPLVCVSDVMESPTVWWNNKPKTKQKREDKEGKNNINNNYLKTKNPKTTYLKNCEEENNLDLTASIFPSSTYTRLDSHLT